MITTEAEADRVARNLAQVTANIERAEGLHERVRAEPRRWCRNRKRLAEASVLIGENKRLQAENAQILGPASSRNGEAR